MNQVQQAYIVGITGGSASGKTSFIKELGELFSRDEVCIISQDNYYKTMEHHKRDEQGHINYDLPECIEVDSFLDDIKKLKKGESIKRREYRFQHEEQHGDWLEFKAAPIIIVEGLFVFYEQAIFNQFDLKLFIDANPEIQLSRRIKRDTTERNISTEFVHYQWSNHVLPAYLNYLLPYRDKADMIIVNNTHFKNSLRVVEDHFKQVLKGHKVGY